MAKGGSAFASSQACALFGMFFEKAVKLKNVGYATEKQSIRKKVRIQTPTTKMQDRYRGFRGLTHAI